MVMGDFRKEWLEGDVAMSKKTYLFSAGSLALGTLLIGLWSVWGGFAWIGGGIVGLWLLVNYGYFTGRY